MRKVVVLKWATPGDKRFRIAQASELLVATLRDATCWDEVVTKLGYEELTRHSLRHTGLTWMADAGVPVHVLRKIAGHADLSTTQRYLHPDRQSVAGAGELLSRHLWSQNGPKLRVV
jgi:integrase